MLHVNTIRAVKRSREKILLLGLVFGAMTLPSAGVLAATFTVNATRDTHDASPGNGVCRDTSTPAKCSLRAAIEEANKRPGWDSIKLSEKTYALSLGTLPVTDHVHILGVSPTSTRIDGNGKLFRVLTVGLGAGDFPFTYFADLTIQNGKAGSGQPGGGVYVASGQFVGERVVITGNQTTSVQGGGVAVVGEFICIDCTISSNTTKTTASGGRMYSGGGLFIFDGGGAWLYRTTISNNTAVRGGGIAGGGYLEMREGTISGNTAKAGGGGIQTMSTHANWWIAWSTITNNKANTTSTSEPALGGGVFHTAGSLQIGKTIIAGNLDGRDHWHENFTPDCATTSTWKNKSYETGYEVNMALISHWDNIYGNVGNLCKAVNVTDGGDVVQPTDRWGYGASTLDVKLGYLSSFNGGDVSTHKLLPGSMAIDGAYSGNPTGFWLFKCYGLDATQTTRPQGAYCDVGSYEAR